MVVIEGFDDAGDRDATKPTLRQFRVQRLSVRLEFGDTTAEPPSMFLEMSEGISC